MKHTFTDKDPLIHFPFYINQYQGILSRYSLEEKGAFISLLCVFLSEDGKFPDDQNQTLRMCLAFSDGEKRSVLSVMEKVIEVGQEILKNQRDKRQKCREAASKGGLARVANAQANATETLKHHLSNTDTENREQIQRTEIEIKKDIKPKGFIKPAIQKLPTFIDAETWNAFVDVRKSIKKPLTEGGVKQILKKLAAFESEKEGWATLALEDSIAGSWQGVFKPKPSFSNSPINKAQEKTRQTMETIFNTDLS